MAEKGENKTGGIGVQRPKQQDNEHGRAQQGKRLRPAVPALRQQPQQEHNRGPETGGGKAGQPAIGKQEKSQQPKTPLAAHAEMAKERQQRRRQKAHMQTGNRRHMGDAQRLKGGVFVLAHALFVVQQHGGGDPGFLAHEPGQRRVQAAAHPARPILRTGAFRGIAHLHLFFLRDGNTEGHAVFQHPLTEIKPGRAAFAARMIDPPRKAQLRAVI